MSYDASIEDLIVEWEEQRSAGQEPTPEELCRDKPELLFTLRQSVAALKSTDWMLSGPDGDDEEFGSQTGRIGEVLGDYRLLEEVGAGGMGVVYRARHLKLEKEVALKVLSESRARDPVAIARFEREMRTVGVLEHANIVSAHHAGADGETYFLAMDLIRGVDVGSLSHRDHPISTADACEIIRQAAIALDYAHSNQIVHRDVKPSNLMVADDGVVKLLDLGLARLSDSADQPGQITSTGHVVGTIDYMAPEQFDDSGRVDRRADIYSLGATLFRLLTGVSPIDVSDSASRLARMRAVALGNLLSLKRQRPELPGELTTLVDSMLSADPADRPAAAADVAVALEPFVNGAGLPSLVRHRVVPSNGPTAEMDAPDDSTNPDPLPVAPDNESRAAPRATSGRHSASAPVPSARGREQGARQTVRTPRGAKDRQAPEAISEGRQSGRGAAAICGLILTIAAIVISIKTDNGTLAVEVGEGVTVEVLEDSGVRLVHKRTQQTYDLRIGEHQQKSGEYAIVVTQQPSGLKFSTTEFEVSRGETTDIRVTLKRDVTAQETETSAVSRPSETPSSKESSKAPAGPVIALPSNLRAGSALTPKLAVSPEGTDVGTVNVGPPGFATLRCVLIGHRGVVWNTLFSKDHRRLYSTSGSNDGSVREWDLQTGKQIRVLVDENEGGTRGAKLIDDGATLVVGGRGEDSIRFIDLDSGDVTRRFGNRSDRVRDLDVSSDGRWLVSTCRGANTLLRDLTTDEEFSLPVSSGHDCKFVLNDRFILFVPDYGAPKLIGVKSRKVERTIASQWKAWRNIGLDRDRRIVSLGTTAPFGLVWDIVDDREIMRFAAETGDVATNTVLTPDARFVVSRLDGEVLRAWNVRTGELVGELGRTGGKEWMFNQYLSPNGRILTACGMQGAIRVFDLNWPQGPGDGNSSVNP